MQQGFFFFYFSFLSLSLLTKKHSQFVIAFWLKSSPTVCFLSYTRYYIYFLCVRFSLSLSLSVSVSVCLSVCFWLCFAFASIAEKRWQTIRETRSEEKKNKKQKQFLDVPTWARKKKKRQLCHLQRRGEIKRHVPRGLSERFVLCSFLWDVWVEWVAHLRQISFLSSPNSSFFIQTIHLRETLSSGIHTTSRDIFSL